MHVTRIHITILLAFFVCTPSLFAGTVKPGLDVFLTHYTHLVKGKRVGLITNQTGINSKGQTNIDLFHQSPDINLSILFAVEHGIRGKILAGEQVSDSEDSKTGIAISSMYSHGYEPKASDLKKIDVLIYDMQDVGSRAYTYIWSMAKAMKACAAQKKIFIVLDRPNPLTGVQIDGPVTEKKWLSLIGLYPVPRTYGLTVGEMAAYLNKAENINCRLTVVPMAGYKRYMNWEDTGLKWVPSSPNIPNVKSAICFAATGTIGTLGFIHIGIGTRFPFQIIGTPWIKAKKTAQYLNAYKLPGIRFRPFYFIPKKGLFKGQKVESVILQITSTKNFMPSRTEICIIKHLKSHYPNQFFWPQSNIASFDKAMGSSSVRLALTQGKSVTSIFDGWKADLQTYDQKRKQFFLYE
ncbi:DUF1343 domain-containing protein [bacterium AH-315-E10]|nr:DUF1343 domain-containing protein [bacterium AH-315-E10]